ncbi:MAG: hypothetical protein HGA67_02650 [Candidatus Yonathbacteria bacterium]|nr:hypothetical protein [Candidatus Yonathbacteria bacterium]
MSVYVKSRSDGLVDVSELAVRHGGGGHKAAAAFRIHDPEFTKLAELFKAKKNK